MVVKLAASAVKPMVWVASPALALKFWVGMARAPVPWMVGDVVFVEVVALAWG